LIGALAARFLADPSARNSRTSPKTLFHAMKVRRRVRCVWAVTMNRDWFTPLHCLAQGGNPTDERRTIHLGMDLFCWRPGPLPLSAPLDGVVHIVANNFRSTGLRTAGHPATLKTKRRRDIFHTTSRSSLHKIRSLALEGGQRVPEVNHCAPRRDQHKEKWGGLDRHTFIFRSFFDLLELGGRSFRVLLLLLAAVTYGRVSRP